MSKDLPTFNGWVSELAKKTDSLLANFFVSEHSQTHIYKGNVTSLPYIVKTYGNDQVTIRTEIDRVLNLLFGRYFDTVFVDVTVEDTSTDGDNRMNIVVDVTVIENETRYSAGRLISTVNSKIMEIMNINNNG